MMLIRYAVDFMHVVVQRLCRRRFAVDLLGMFSGALLLSTCLLHLSTLSLWCFAKFKPGLYEFLDRFCHRDVEHCAADEGA